MKEKISCTVCLQKFDSNLWGHHFPINKAISVPFIKENGSRLVLGFADGYTIQAALLGDGNGGHFININKEVRDRYRLNIGDELIVTLTKDDSKYGLPCPEEVSELFVLDDNFNTLFHKLTPGKQRSLLYVIAKPKTSDKRIEKALIIAEHLKINEGRLDFKMLHEAFKMGLNY